MQNYFESELFTDDLIAELTSLSKYVLNHFIEDPDFVVIEWETESDFGYDAEARLSDNDEGGDYPSQFTITVDPEMFKIDSEDFLTSMAHELIHVAQMADLRLKSTDGYFIWQGQKFSTKNATKALYYSWPWEVEAYGMERAMYYGWKQNQDIIKKIQEMAA